MALNRLKIQNTATVNPASNNPTGPFVKMANPIKIPANNACFVASLVLYS
jgi:hypothetical protein